MARVWTLVKMSEETREMLEEVRQSMLRAEEMRLRSLDRDNRDRVSLDQVIRILIELRQRHAERRTAALERRRARKAASRLPAEVQEIGAADVIQHEEASE